MAKRKYVVASEEGAAYTQVEAGETVSLELDEDTERALLAAGWLEKETASKEGKS